MGARLRIYNRARKRLLVSEGWAADSFWARLRGLLGHPPLQPGQGLWIVPCNWIHTLGMGFPIDVLYLDRTGQVLRMASEMHPNRIGHLVWRANSVLELPVGAIEDTGTRVGDRLEITRLPQGRRGDL
jgi:uncharacterized membrane protein (UPF0127 family)